MLLQPSGRPAALNLQHQVAAKQAEPLDHAALRGHRGQQLRAGVEEPQVGHMAKSWAPPRGMAIARACVHGIVTRMADDEGRRWTLLSSTWEVLVPQLFLLRKPSPGMDKPDDGSTG